MENIERYSDAIEKIKTGPKNKLQALAGLKNHVTESTYRMKQFPKKL